MKLVINGDAMKRARVERALSQRDLARLTNLRPATVCDVENGAAARPSTIRAIASALNVDVLAISKLV